MSELREAISTAAWEHVKFTRLPDMPDVMDKSEVSMNINGTWIRINVPVNAILDAVIAALPEEYPTTDADYDNGFNWAIGQTRSILLEAKEGK